MLRCRDVHWSTPAGEPVLEGVSLCVDGKRVGLVGRNGAGKSTLLDVLLGLRTPGSGIVERSGRIGYLPQGHRLEPDRTVAWALGIEERLRAIARVESGAFDARDEVSIGGDWDVEARARRLLDRLGLARVSIDRFCETLSGGEVARVALAGLLLDEPDDLVLDEPTNHLDEATRETLYDLVAGWKGGLLVVSHDRELLRRVDEIVEISPLGLARYGGGYDVYRLQKDGERAAALADLAHARRHLDEVEKEARIVSERQARRLARGRARREDGSQPRTVLDAWRQRSERTSRRLGADEERKESEARARLERARSRVPDEDSFRVDLEATAVPAGKGVVELTGAGYRHPGGGWVLRGVDLSLAGPFRVALRGPNGSGKTTLVRLVLGDLTPTEGTARLGVRQASTLDQRTAILDPGRSVLENLVAANPDLGEPRARSILGRFLFPDEDAFRPVSVLSGGERMRAALACALHSRSSPQLLVLDEPTNDLDLESVEEVVRALQGYQGALLVVSHDLDFLREVGCERQILLAPDAGPLRLAELRPASPPAR